MSRSLPEWLATPRSFSCARESEEVTGERACGLECHLIFSNTCRKLTHPWLLLPGSHVEKPCLSWFCISLLTWRYLVGVQDIETKRMKLYDARVFDMKLSAKGDFAYIFSRVAPEKAPLAVVTSMEQTVCARASVLILGGTKSFGCEEGSDWNIRWSQTKTRPCCCRAQ